MSGEQDKKQGRQIFYKASSEVFFLPIFWEELHVPGSRYKLTKSYVTSAIWLIILMPSHDPEYLNLHTFKNIFRRG